MANASFQLHSRKLPHAFFDDDLLEEPLYGFTRDGETPHKPTGAEIFSEWVDSINFFRTPNRFVVAVGAIFHLATAGFCLVFFGLHLSLKSSLYLLVSIYLLASVYNTFWFHRYCSHAAFKFKSKIMTLPFRLTNPYVFRDEVYVLPHLIHHQRSDKIGDPYGPHLGCMGSYLAIESNQKYNTDLSEAKFTYYKSKLAHIGLVMNDYTTFKLEGSFESVPVYVLRVLFSQVFFSLIAYLVGGIQCIFAWYAAVFITDFLIRDFNYRGHGGKNFKKKKRAGWEFDSGSYARNHRFYGYLASEWHDNHHRCPTSANNGFLKGQFDAVFQLVRILSKVGIVESYNDMRQIFLSRQHGPGNLSESFLLFDK